MKAWTEVKKTGTTLTGSKLHIDTILNRELHVQAVDIKPSSRNDGNCLTIQYEIFEQLKNKDGELLWKDEAKTAALMGWVQHITFTGSKKLEEDFGIIDILHAVAKQWVVLREV